MVRLVRFLSYFILTFLLFNPDVYAKEQETAVLRVILNMEEKGDFFVLLSKDGDVLFPKGEFLGLGFREIPEKARIEEGYISLSSLSKDVEFKIDRKESTLIITADPGLLRRQVIDLHRRPSQALLHLSENTAFFNYSLGYNMGDGFESLSLPFNLGIRLGSLLGYSNFSYTRTQREERFVRGTNSITMDNTRALRRYVLGDFFATSAGRLGGGGL